MLVIDRFKRIALSARSFARRAGYELRKRKRDSKLYPVRFITQFNRIRADVKDIFEQDRDLLSESQTLEKVVEGREKLTSQSTKLGIVTLLLYAALLCSHAGLPQVLAIPGLTVTTAPGMREMLLSAILWLSLYQTHIFSNILAMNAVITGLVPLYYTRTLEQIMLLAHIRDFPLVLYSSVYSPYLVQTRTSRWIYKVLFFYRKILSTIFTLSLLSIRLYTYYSIVTTPELSAGLTLSILIMCVLIEVYITIYGIAVTLPLPYRDYTLLKELNLLEQVNPEAAAARRREVYGADTADYAATFPEKSDGRPEGGNH